MFDGDGTGDERRIHSFQKLLINWVGSNNQSESENLSMLNSCSSLLKSIESSYIKSGIIKKRVIRELEVCKTSQKHMETSIEHIQKVIDESKIILQDAQKERQHKLYYNMMVQDIAVFPSQHNTQDIVSDLNAKIADLKLKNSSLNSDLTRWRQQFKIIATSSNDLWQMLEQHKHD